MKKIISIFLGLVALITLLTLTSCEKKKQEPMLPNQKIDLMGTVWDGEYKQYDGELKDYRKLNVRVVFYDSDTTQNREDYLATFRVFGGDVKDGEDKIVDVLIKKSRNVIVVTHKKSANSSVFEGRWIIHTQNSEQISMQKEPEYFDKTDFFDLKRVTRGDIEGTLF